MSQVNEKQGKVCGGPEPYQKPMDFAFRFRLDSHVESRFYSVAGGPRRSADDSDSSNGNLEKSLWFFCDLIGLEELDHSNCRRGGSL